MAILCAADANRLKNFICGANAFGNERKNQACWPLGALHVCPMIDCGEAARSEEHTSELQSLLRISYAVFCLKTKTTHISLHLITTTHQQKHHHSSQISTSS